MRKWTIIGLDGFTDDCGCSCPETAAYVIRCRKTMKELTEQEVEEIAQQFNCYVRWDSTQ